MQLKAKPMQLDRDSLPGSESHGLTVLGVLNESNRCLVTENPGSTYENHFSSRKLCPSKTTISHKHISVSKAAQKHFSRDPDLQMHNRNFRRPPRKKPSETSASLKQVCLSKTISFTNKAAASHQQSHYFITEQNIYFSNQFISTLASFQNKENMRFQQHALSKTSGTSEIDGDGLGD